MKKMKKIIIPLIALIIILIIQPNLLAANSLSFEILETDSSYKNIAGIFELNQDWYLQGNYSFSQIEQYSIDLKINKFKVGITRDIFSNEKLTAKLGVGYNYGTVSLDSKYFSDIIINSKERGLHISGRTEVALDEKISAFGEINYLPQLNLTGSIKTKDYSDYFKDKSKKYTGQLGLKFQLANNLMARVGYNFSRYLEDTSKYKLEDKSINLKDNDQSGISIGLETRF